MKPSPQAELADPESAPHQPAPLRQWLTTLYGLHAEPLRGFLRRKYGPGPPDPEDCVQHAFLQLARLDWSFAQKIAAPKSFLYRAAENALIDQKRRELTRHVHTRDVQQGAAGNEVFSGFVFSPENVLVSKAELALIQAAIEAMPERRRTCLLMHRIDDLSFAEIGRQLGITAPAVRQHCERAMAEIEAAVAQAEGDLS